MKSMKVDKATGRMLERALMYFHQKVISEMPEGKERKQLDLLWKRAWDSIEYNE